MGEGASREKEAMISTNELRKSYAVSPMIDEINKLQSRAAAVQLKDK